MARRKLISQADLARRLGVERSSVMRRMDYKGGPIPTYEKDGKRLVDEREALDLWTATKRGQGGVVGANPEPLPPAEDEGDDLGDIAAPQAAAATPAAPNLGTKAAELRLAILATKAMSDRIAIEKERGNLVDKATAVRQVFTFAKKYRDSLINWPARVGPVLAAEIGADPTVLTTALERLVREFLTDIADQRPNIG